MVKKSNPGKRAGIKVDGTTRVNGNKVTKDGPSKRVAGIDWTSSYKMVIL